ncbi:putative Auxin-responsive protein SAUR50 [Cocos nucifera]|uniref:Putative Auxin-responsive protein SAUR50 n=1 Tax=Cocos nucifera TaxID=13894 RepID=A0A8K0N5H9_COCNU|nr:putative Auxin-responsive protein SAUR50 [Cocos nucifera]
MEKCGKILYVARVRQMLRRWSTRASLIRGWRAPADVPAGHVAICVGSSGRRFVVRAAYLNHPVFRKLLAEAEEEYGFSASAGPIAVPCDESSFEQILGQISSSSTSATRFANLDDLNGCFSFFHVGIRSSPFCRCSGGSTRSRSGEPQVLRFRPSAAEAEAEDLLLTCYSCELSLPGIGLI